MRTKTLIISLAAALLCVGAAMAGNGPAKIRYSFQGQLTATPANGGVSITVQGGNKAALRAMLGQPVTQTFAYGTKTEFLKWSKGIPTVVQAGDLAAGDYVTVNVRAPRGLRSRRRSSSSRPASSAITARSSSRPTSRCTCSAAR